MYPQIKYHIFNFFFLFVFFLWHWNISFYKGKDLEMLCSILFYLCLFLFVFMYLLHLENLIFDWTQTRGRSSQRGHPTSLGNLFLAFFLASFLLLARNSAYSMASSLFFLVRCFFGAMHWRLCCRTCGVTRCWILGALVLGFLPSLFRGFLTTSIGRHLLL